MLPKWRVPTLDEFLAVPYYNGSVPELVGTPYFMGYDEFGCRIYFMGMWNQRKNITTTLKILLGAAGITENRYILQDAFPLINFSTKIGGLLSKRYRFGFGGKMTVWGMQRQYFKFVELVESVKVTVSHMSKTD
jgi:hypothetical protein